MSIFLISRSVLTKNKEVDQELQRGYMSRFLIRYVLKLKEVEKELQKGHMNIFLIRQGDVI